MALQRDASNGAPGAKLRRRVRLVVAQNRLSLDEPAGRDDAPRHVGNGAPASSVATALPSSTGADAVPELVYSPPAQRDEGEEVRSLAIAVDARLHEMLIEGESVAEAGVPERESATHRIETQPSEVEAPVAQPDVHDPRAMVQEAGPVEHDVDVLTEEDLRLAEPAPGLDEEPPAERTTPAERPTPNERPTPAERPRRRIEATTHVVAAPQPAPRWTVRRRDVVRVLRQAGIGLLIVAVSAGLAVLLT